jgi:hypothetical protein
VGGPPARRARRIEDGIGREGSAAAIRVRGDRARVSSHGTSTSERLQRLRDARDIGGLRDRAALVGDEERDATVTVDSEPVGVERPLRETRQQPASVAEVDAGERMLGILSGHAWYLRIVGSGSL